MMEKISSGIGSFFKGLFTVSLELMLSDDNKKDGVQENIDIYKEHPAFMERDKNYVDSNGNPCSEFMGNIYNDTTSEKIR